MSDQVQDCLGWWRARLDSIEEFKDKTRICYDDADLLKLFSLPTARPYAGVCYENLLGQFAGTATDNTGMAVQAQFSIVLCFDVNTLGEDNRPTEFQNQMLKRVRALAMDQQGPKSCSRKWRFVAERSPGKNDKLKVWVQNWAMPMIMTQANLR